MDVQVSEVIVWPKDNSKTKRVVKFELGKLNVIHGASQTGKSAIIPIIDYCLCSSRSNIPVGTIINKASWFGVRLKVEDNYMVIARENKDNSSGKFYYDFSKNAPIPDEPCINETDADMFRIKLNNIFGIPFFNVDENIYRPSFRDLVAFNFQPQNIVANPNCLLYKSDLSKYRTRLRNIFNFAIGAENADTLYKKQLKQKFEEELDALVKERNEKQSFIFNETMKQQDLIIRAIGYGLIEKEDVILNDQSSIINNLKKLTDMSLSELSLSIKGSEMVAEKLLDLDRKLAPLNLQLREYQKKRNSVSDYINLNKDFLNNLETKKERLNLASFIKEFCTSNVKDISVLEDLDTICAKLHTVEETIRKNTPTKNSQYEMALTKTDTQILKINDDINKLFKEYNTLQGVTKEKNLLEGFLIDIGRAKNIINLLTQDTSEVDKKISDAESAIVTNTVEVDPIPILINIKKEMEKYIPKFAEFSRIDRFDPRDLTIKVLTDKNESVYLSQTGSGSNWVAYHLAMSLGFQKYFIDNNSFIFNFLVYDQPSQVYFPSAKYDKQKNTYIFEEGGDIKNVKMMFELMNKAITDNKNKLQVIVLDHAGENAWGKLSNIHEVEDWSDGCALIPKDW